jgi:hypothetical protein
MPLTQVWDEFCHRGRLPVNRQRESVNLSAAPDGTVRGYYSDLVLDPTRDPTHSLYPSHDHTRSADDHRQMVVETRLVNDMKTHLSDTEFWRLIEHLYGVGVDKGRIELGSARRLPPDWSPTRHY